MTTETPRERGVDVASAPVQCVVFEDYTLERLLSELEAGQGRTPAFRTLLARHRIPRRFPEMNDFRVGPRVDDKILMDWILLVEPATGGRQPRLIGHGITTRIAWSGVPSELPRGWQGAVRRSYERSFVERAVPNTLIGLFITVEDEFRNQGWAERIVTEMKALAARAGLARLVIPLRLPLRYDRQYATIPYAEFATLKRPDGEYADHWLRLHVRLGARVLGTCTTSHQHAMHLDDFRQQFPGVALAPGNVLVERGGEWFEAFIDVDRECVVINEGCVWVQHAPSADRIATAPERPPQSRRWGWPRLFGNRRKPADDGPADTIYPLW